MFDRWLIKIGFFIDAILRYMLNIEYDGIQLLRLNGIS